MAKQFTSTFVTVIRAYRLYSYSLLSTNIKSKLRLCDMYITEASRKYCSYVSPDQGETNSIHESINLSREIDKSLINSLVNILCIKPSKALDICYQILKIQNLESNEILEMITVLTEAGVTIPSIIRSIPILVQNRTYLKEKITYIKYLDNNINDMLPLVQIKLNYLYTLTPDEQKNNKIKYLAEKLNCDVYKLCERLIRYPCLITVSYDKIKNILKMLKAFNCLDEDILNNLWLFKYRPLTVHRKIITLQMLGVTHMKPWIFRCNCNALRRHIKELRKKSSKKFDGGHIDLLVSKLKMTEKEIEFYLNWKSNIFKQQLPKINRTLDILLKYGYKGEEILSMPFVFQFKSELIERRIITIKKLKKHCRLTLLCSSEKMFQRFIKSESIIHYESTHETDNIKHKN